MTTLTASLLTLGLLAPAPSTGSPDASPVESVRWIGADGEVLPFRTEEEVLGFLQTADIVSATPIRKGVNRPLKLLLVKDGVAAHAIFRTVNTRVRDRSVWQGKVALPTYRDHFAFECAAFELGRLLGYSRVPPVVERRYRRRAGSVQIWVENAVDETTRRRRGLQPPSRARWIHQTQSRILFDTLIRNFDRNTGNLLIDGDWNLWLIDHTRSFPPDRRLRDLDRVQSVPGSLWNGLCNLGRGTVEEALAPYLRPRELEALFARWQELVAQLQRRSAALGTLPPCGQAAAPGSSWQDP